MTWPDLLNGTFEFCGAFFILLSILKLHKDKQVRGVHWLQVSYFFAWGLWNLYYYPHLNQWMSFIGGIAVVATNGVWLGQMLYYLHKEKQRDRLTAWVVDGLIKDFDRRRGEDA